MAVPNILIDTTFSSKDIRTVLSVYEYAVLATGTLRFQLRLVVAGGGDYVVSLRLNDGDAQTDDPMLPKTTVTAAAGETKFWCPTISIDLIAGDVVNVMVLGLADDNSISGSIRIFSDAALQPTTAGLTLDVAATGEAGLDFSNIKAAANPTTLTNITIPVVTLTDTATSVTNAVKPDWNAIANPTTTVNLSGTTVKTAADIATILSGITSMAAWLRGLFRKDAMNAPAKVEINTGGGTFSELTDSLEALRDNYTTPPTTGAIDTTLTAAHGSGLWGGVGGIGATSTLIKINDGFDPVDGVEVWVTTDPGGSNKVASGNTDVLGQVTFMLDPATYYVWKQHGGYTFANPETMVVT